MIGNEWRSLANDQKAESNKSLFYQWLHRFQPVEGESVYEFPDKNTLIIRFLLLSDHTEGTTSHFPEKKICLL